MLAPEPGRSNVVLEWSNVGLAFLFVSFNILLSNTFGLGLGRLVLVSALRCALQLAVVAVLLHRIFATDNPWVVAGIAFLLNNLAAFEIVVNRSTSRHQYMFPSVLIGMVGSTIPISMVGIRFALSVQPFWEPIHYVPIVGMLCGSAISGIVLSVSHILKELQENRDKVEVYLAFGATRMEACRPIAIDALKVALTPVLNQMSVVGLIAIPGTMTGAILGGASVQQAAKLQTIIMFMISSSTCLATLFTTFAVIAVAVDTEHRIRMDRIDCREHGIWRAREWIGKKLVWSVKKAACGWREKDIKMLSEHTPLLSGE
ncbi:UPF0014-domain-containing protein [Collybia nuda]|uniref:UPF0014-domain-containing protein n=1 Tax=Collybia nuda TaxID=64659 RepID=A0A9P6CKN1_9AGAR|nr:UPF0014-domain-containing protein [Collybia nuda]